MEQFVSFLFSTNAKKKSPTLVFLRLMQMEIESREVERMNKMLLLYSISLLTLIKDLGHHMIGHCGVQNTQPTVI